MTDQDGWTAEAVFRAGADSLLAAHKTIRAQAAEITRLRAEVARKDEALEFYADPSGWNQPPVKTHAGLISVEYENQASKIQHDRGRRARAARMPAEGRAALEQEGG